MRNLKILTLLLALCMVASRFTGWGGAASEEVVESAAASESAGSEVAEAAPETAEEGGEVPASIPDSVMEEVLEEQTVAISKLVIDNPYSFPLTEDIKGMDIETCTQILQDAMDRYNQR